MRCKTEDGASTLFFFFFFFWLMLPLFFFWILSCNSREGEAKRERWFLQIIREKQVRRRGREAAVGEERKVSLSEARASKKAGSDASARICITRFEDATEREFLKNRGERW